MPVRLVRHLQLAVLTEVAVVRLQPADNLATQLNVLIRKLNANDVSPVVMLPVGQTVGECVEAPPVRVIAVDLVTLISGQIAIIIMYVL